MANSLATGKSMTTMRTGATAGGKKMDAKKQKSDAPKAPAKSNPTANNMRGGSGPDVAPDAERKYRAEDGLRTLQRAEEVRRDGGLMKDIEDCRQTKMRDLANIKVDTSKPTMKMKKD